MVWQPKVFVNNTVLLQSRFFDFSCPGGCTFLDLRRKRTGFPAGSSPAGLPFAGPCSVCLSVEGLKITQPWIPNRADIRPDIAMGDTFMAAVVSHKARREERQDWKRRGDKSQYGTQILTEDAGQGSERAHKRWCSGPEEKDRHESLGDFALAG